MARTLPPYLALQTVESFLNPLLGALGFRVGWAVTDVFEHFPLNPYGWHVTFVVIDFLLTSVWLGAMTFGASKRNIRAITFSIIIHILVITDYIIWAIVLIIDGDGDKLDKTLLIVCLFIWVFVQAIILAMSYDARNELRLAVPPPVDV